MGSVNFHSFLLKNNKSPTVPLGWGMLSLHKWKILDMSASWAPSSFQLPILFPAMPTLDMSRQHASCTGLDSLFHVQATKIFSPANIYMFYKDILGNVCHRNVDSTLIYLFNFNIFKDVYLEIVVTVS